MKHARTCEKTLAAGAAALIAGMASAATSITVDSVVQRWPWNNKLDIAYTVTGGQDVANADYKKIVFTTVIGGTTYAIDGDRVGASASAGAHVVTWTPPSGINVRDSACSMTAAVYASDVPSGDDYLIVDLTKTEDNITYEGLFATQDASNARYNTADYKTDKLVLRKVPAGQYTTGDSTHTGFNNSVKTWTTDRNYYIGVFLVTQYQYKKLYGSNPSSNTKVIDGNEVSHRPVERVSWNVLRVEGTAPDSPIPTVSTANTGTFFQRLNYITGNRFDFDLPTEVMFEIAERAGSTGVYFWEGFDDTTPGTYAVYKDGTYDGASSMAVGSRKPNAWGLYDVAGNVWDLCRDCAFVSGSTWHNMASNESAFKAYASSHGNRVLRGGPYFNANNAELLCASRRSNDKASNSNSLITGFRVAMIVK